PNAFLVNALRCSDQLVLVHLDQPFPPCFCACLPRTGRASKGGSILFDHSQSRWVSFTLSKSPTHLYFPNVAGGGVFRFQDGSLLTVGVTAGALLFLDLAAGMAHLTQTYQITGGNGRFKGASGTLKLTAILTPVVFNAGGVFLATDTGESEGTSLGVAIGEEGQDERQ